ncbi:MAG: M3 family metallopeptidase [Azonexus sp.]|nr:M3 family metallopeptidase [Betaproteobacteria bacterium]MBK8919158.1 M3 family metallopeptidase [Betaproteobacteria bacterium]MBP6036520.1 M3 family metallopeptidase [Azonexus sp.]MBP6907128.1 M3 family metallopeptidase [Azonexus sp.]
MTAANPLLAFACPDHLLALPRFDAIAPEHVGPAVETLLADARGLQERLTSAAVPATWDDFAGPLADGIEHLSRAWGIVGHLHAVNDTPPWREAYNAMLPEVTRFYTELGQDLKLFDKYRALRAGPEYAGLSAARRRIVDNEIRDFRLSGAELPDDQKPRFKAIMEELAGLAAKFQENLLDATNAFAETVTDAALLAGLPPDALEAARTAAEKAGSAGWRFTLQAPSYGPVMQYAENRDLRARLYRAYATRAAEFHEGSSKPEWDNTPVMQRMLELRLEDARMLGYANFAEVSLVPKMADSPSQVLAFLRELASKARPFAERDYAELRQFAADNLGLATLEPWDVAFASERLLQARYAFSEQEVKQYFAEPAVLAGLFRVIEELFGVHVKPDTAPVWHGEVRFYRLETPAGELVGQFYLDLYARETKRGGAWMDEAQGRRRCTAGMQTPIAYLNCNFSAPVGGKPATFTHDEVITLFHETGHGLHHLLTRVDELGVSGIHGVEWDAVELPSQFMENYCWEWPVVERMTAHAETGAPLPRALFDKMLAARNFQSGLQTVRQLEFSLFDMLLHADFDPAGEGSGMALLETVRNEVAVIRPPAWQRFPNSFSHIFGGGYAAGYFSYKWAEVLSADAYAAFEEAGDPFDAATGRRFLEEILSVGGARPALESFTAFRGREPRVDALLRHSGMIAA